MSKGEAGNAAIVTLGLKNRSRAASSWHDAQRPEHSGLNGSPIQQQVSADINLKVLTDDELALFEELLVKTLPLALSKEQLFEVREWRVRLGD